MDNVFVYYRLSDKAAGSQKVKSSFINNENCLHNFIINFGSGNLHIIADSISDNTKKHLKHIRKIYNITFEVVNYKSGAKNFSHALDLGLKHNDNDIVYFVEDDFLHKNRSKQIMLEAFNETCADYVSLYDHPDKYIDHDKGGPNPFIKNGGELSRVLLTTSTHWKTTGSTVMTFAAKVRTLKEDEKAWRNCANGRITRSFRTFTDLCKNRININNFLKKKRIVISPIPGWATHGEPEYLAPLINWEDIAGQ